jgi:hypothetical protein
VAARIFGRIKDSFVLQGVHNSPLTASQSGWVEARGKE